MSVLKVPNKNLQFRESDKGGWEWSDDGITWNFTFRTESEIRAMHSIPLTITQEQEDERELFGDTLDEPIPEDLWEMIQG